MKTQTASLIGAAAFVLSAWTGIAVDATRALPKPLASHPGNVFLQGEEVSVALPSKGHGWRAVDYDDKVIAEIATSEKEARLGILPVGFYRLKPQNPHPSLSEGESKSSSEWISLAVLAPFQAPTPVSSPVGLDVAMAWFYKGEKMDSAANLCALAGVNWVRDRLAWGEAEPQRGEFAPSTRYDASGLIQSKAGLQVLQVNHSSPGWANRNGKRFPTDLRDIYNSYRELAQRWQGKVLAFEPWNEADITMFGGHTGSEMASLQKAAWWGLKTGNTNIVACWNVFAMHNKNQLADIHENEAWPYFDTFNLHHYAKLEEYSKLYADFRAVSAGRPMWVTECNVPVKWAGDEKLKEPTDGDLRVQAERVAKIFAHSLYEGAAVTYYFMLPHYVEGQTQFGILRPDLTPRPAFVALAAVGRLMADAKTLGQWVPEKVNGVTAFWFAGKPDGQAQEVLVAWAGKDATELMLPEVPQRSFDHLGRATVSSGNAKLTMAPQFFLYPAGTAKKLGLKAAPTAPERLEGKPSPVVLQALMPVEKTLLSESCYKIAQTETLPINIYNFGATAAQGTLRVEGPKDWKIFLPEKMELTPGDKKGLDLKIEVGSQNAADVQTVRISGDFGAAGKPILSVRVKVEAQK